MKKFTLFLFTALFAVSAVFAQQLPLKSRQDAHRYMNVFNNAALKKHQLQEISKQNVLKSNGKQVRMTATSRRQVPRRARYISEQPEGTEKLYSVSYEGYGYSLFGLYIAEGDAAVGKFVFADDGKVYWQNPLPHMANGSWVEGTLTDGTITFQLPQCLSFYEDEGYGSNLSMLEFATNTYVYGSNQVFELGYADGDLTVKTDLSYEAPLGLTYTDDYTWCGYTMHALSFEKFNDEPVTAPEGVEPVQCAVVATDADGNTSSYLVNVAVKDNDIYIQGIYENLPEAWIKGKLEGGKAVFAQQFIGADEYFQYFVPASYEMVEDDYSGDFYASYSIAEGDVEFSYDATTQTLTLETPYMINAGTSVVNYAAAAVSATILPFVEKASTPKAPVWSDIYDGGFSYYSYGYGWGYLAFEIDNVDEDGSFILPDKLSYQIYTRTNGVEKSFVLSAEDYIYLDEDMSEISFNFSDGWDIGTSGSQRYVYYYVTGPEAYGIQTIYRGAGEERRSEIVWMDVEGMGSEVQPEIATPDYPAVDPDNVGASVQFSYFTGAEDVLTEGFGKAETYDVAIKLDNPDLVGTKIESITFPLISVSNVTNISGWISTQLCIDENGKNVPDLASKKLLSIGLEEGIQTVKLATPYTIPEGGVYVGYSFTVTKIENQKDDNIQPIATIPGYNDGGLYIHSSKTMIKWIDCAPYLSETALIGVVVSGRNIKENAATIAGETVYTLTNKEVSVPLKVVNYGAEGVSSIDLEYTLDNQTATQHIELDEDEAIDGFYGKAAQVTLTVPALSKKGIYELQLDVKKVNGQDNQAVETSSSVVINALDVLPIHRPLLEEYTGTWCGYCPRGFMGLELMNQLYGKDFVGVSYHNSDPMEIMASGYFPSNVEGFPDAWLDRVKQTDAYCGDGAYMTFGIDKTWEERAKVFGVAELQLSSSWNDSEDAIEVTATASFPFGYDESAEYRFGYILVQNGMTGEGSDWEQSNYYGGATGWPEDMNIFTEGESYVSGLVFNDVAVAVSDYFGMGISGTLPEQMAQDGSADNSYVFELADVVNTSGENIVQDKNQLYVVAVLIDAQTGEVVNAIKEKVGQSSIVGINTTASAFDAGKTAEYFDAAGRRISTPQRGINFKKVTYSDGTQRVIKTLVK